MKWTKYLLLMLILAAAIPTRAQDRVEALKDSIRSSFIVADRFREVFLHPVQPRTFTVILDLVFKIRQNRIEQSVVFAAKLGR